MLKRHLTTKYSSFENKPKNYFVQKLTEMKSTKKIISSFGGSIQKLHLQKSIILGELNIAKVGKPNTIGEELLLSAAKVMAICMFGESSAKQLDMIPLSNNIVCHRIESRH